jgi:hypothetical protein
VCNDGEIIALGEKAHTVFPECPTLGVDIVRDTKTGNLCVMEVNPEGWSWHFSSEFSKNAFPIHHVRDLYAQFGALERIAELLINKTREEAN